MIEVLKHRRETPEWATEYLREIGGSNIYGEPNFIIFWGETRVIMRGDGPVLHGDDMPCWILAMWHPPDDPDPLYNAGPPQLWDYSILGPYPYRGSYHVVQPFCKKTRVNGKTVIEPAPAELGRSILEFTASLVRIHRFDSFKKRRQVMKDLEEKRTREEEKQIADRLQDASPAWQDAISYSGQVNKHSVVQQRIEQIERNHRSAMRFRKERPKGLSVGA